MSGLRALKPPPAVPFRKLNAVTAFGGGAPDYGQLARAIQQQQDNAEQATRKAREFPEAKGVRVNGVSFPAYAAGPPEVGQVRIDHKLGRNPIGWKVVRNTGAMPQLHEVSRTNRWLTLMNKGASAAAVDLWVW